MHSTRFLTNMCHRPRLQRKEGYLPQQLCTSLSRADQLCPYARYLGRNRSVNFKSHGQGCTRFLTYQIENCVFIYQARRSAPCVIRHLNKPLYWSLPCMLSVTPSDSCVIRYFYYFFSELIMSYLFATVAVYFNSVMSGSSQRDVQFNSTRNTLVKILRRSSQLKPR